MIRYDDGSGHPPDAYEGAARCIGRIVWGAASIFAAHGVLSIPPIAHWADALPATINLPRFGGTLPLGWPLWLLQHPAHMFKAWLDAILGRFP